MAVGDEINYANYKAMVTAAWRISNSWGNQDITIYLSACSFVIQAKCNSVLFRSSSIDVNAYYYSGSSWVYAYNLHLTLSGAQNPISTKAYHNRADEGTTTGDQHQHHLWKFVVNMSWAGSAGADFVLWASGLETMNETEYNSYFKGEKLMGIKCEYKTGVTDSSFVLTNHPSTLKGTPISISSGTYKYICYEKGYID